MSTPLKAPPARTEEIRRHLGDREGMKPLDQANPSYESEIAAKRREDDAKKRLIDEARDRHLSNARSNGLSMPAQVTIVLVIALVLTALIIGGLVAGGIIQLKPV